MKTALLIFGSMAILAAAFASETQIQGGQLWVEGQWKSDLVTVSAPGTLGGAGTVESPQVNVAGTIAPGIAPSVVGTLSVDGTLNFQAGGKYACDITGPVTSDALAVDMASGSGQVEVNNPGGFIPVDQVIIDAFNLSDYSSFTATAGWGLRELPVEDLVLTSLTGDTDSDGLPDWCELAYTGSRTALDPNAHNDTDGVPNGDEVRAGTDPTDETSYLRITQVREVAGGKIKIAWPSVASRWLNVANPQYELSVSTGLITGEFTAVAGNLPSTPPDNYYTNTPAATFQAWRIRKQ